MTFYEAALRVLEAAARPLHVREITERSIGQDLLSHVGKTPEQTMLSRLAAMARRPRDRKVVVTAKDTFALTDWSLPEDLEALAQTGLVPQNPEEALPSLRPAERHPEASATHVRSAGRSERKRHRDDDEGRRRRFPPLAEVAFELLTEAGDALRPEELIARARGRAMAGEELGRNALLAALFEDNQRRIDAGRRPQFVFASATGSLALERSDSQTLAAELQAPFAAALGAMLSPALVAAELGGDRALHVAVKSAIKEARRAMASAMRRQLGALESGGLEKAVVRMLHGLHFHELKVAKRSNDGPLFTGRRREGSVELRYAVRVLRATAAVDRRAVLELRKDLGHYGAQVGLIATAAEARADARSEAQSAGSLVMLWCGEALAEKFFDAKVGVHVQTFEVYAVDKAFFDKATADGLGARARRDDRLKEREAQLVHEAPAEGDDGLDFEVTEADGADSDEPNADVQTGSLGPQSVAGDGGPLAEQDRKRRRRRRRGRRGRGPRPGESAAPVGVVGAPPPPAGAEPSVPPVAQPTEPS